MLRIDESSELASPIDCLSLPERAKGSISLSGVLYNWLWSCCEEDPSRALPAAMRAEERVGEKDFSVPPFFVPFEVMMIELFNPEVPLLDVSV